MMTREQRYAAHSYQQVAAWGQEHPKGSKKRSQYGALAHKLPVLVRTAGLVQALAFVDARGEEAHHQLLAHLAATISEGRATPLTAKDLVARSREAPLPEYMRLSQQVMAALLWYKRFAQSVLEVVQGEEPTEAEKGASQ
jgi:CRISPR-associated protein Cmr5